jgi:hypothetical protein
MNSNIPSFERWFAGRFATVAGMARAWHGKRKLVYFNNLGRIFPEIRLQGKGKNFAGRPNLTPIRQFKLTDVRQL